MSRKLLTYADLELRGLGSRSTILRKCKDPELGFPSPMDTGYGQKRWDENEITEWEDNRKVNQAQPDSINNVKTTSHSQGFVIVKPGKNGRQNTVCLTLEEALEVADKLQQASKGW